MKKKESKKLSLITDTIIFFVNLLVVILLIKPLNITENQNNLSKDKYQQVLALSDDSNVDISIQNKLAIENIKEKYNINIEYGDNIRQAAEKVSATGLYNENIVNNNIKLIESELKKYPANFFNNVKTNNKYAITIILLDKFNNDNLALASRNNLNEYKIYISNTDNFSRAFEHEIFHIIEYYICSKTKTADVFYNWSSLNPEGFEYNDDIVALTNDYVYTDVFSLKEAFFVSKYSKVSEKEDRAEVFAELMTQKTKPLYLNKNENIYKKAKYLSDIISQNMGFNIDASKAYWNRFFM